MNLKNLCLLVSLGLCVQLSAQTKPKLAAKIETLASKILKTVHTEDVFLNTGKSNISQKDHRALRTMIMQNGFPTIPMVGREASHKAWMMIQLCDFDLQFQKAVLEQMRRACRKGEVIREDFAMLTDRIRVNQEKPQLYGTQYFMNDFGDLILYPLYDEGNVNERRKSLRISKLSEAEAKVKDTIAKSTTKENKDTSEDFDSY